MNTKGSGSARDDGLYFAVLQAKNYKITFIYKQIARLAGERSSPASAVCHTASRTVRYLTFKLTLGSACKSMPL